LVDSSVRNIIFDLGGVLLDWNPDKILQEFYSDPALRILLMDELFQHPDWRAFNRGALREIELAASVRGRTGRPAAEISALLHAIRESLVTKPDTVTLLRSLHRRRIPLYCLSDMPVSVYAHVRLRHEFWDAFSGIVISGEVKMMKPEREVFEHLLTRFRLEPRQTVFVDDLPLNIEGARAVGLHAIQFRDAAQCARDLDALLAL
jgi:HAD superfamily hydrolase (TIGR01509 family)